MVRLGVREQGIAQRLEHQLHLLASHAHQLALSQVSSRLCVCLLSFRHSFFRHCAVCGLKTGDDEKMNGEKINAQTLRSQCH